MRRGRDETREGEKGTERDERREWVGLTGVGGEEREGGREEGREEGKKEVGMERGVFVPVRSERLLVSPYCGSQYAAAWQPRSWAQVSVCLCARCEHVFQVKHAVSLTSTGTGTHTRTIFLACCGVHMLRFVASLGQVDQKSSFVGGRRVARALLCEAAHTKGGPGCGAPTQSDLISSQFSKELEDFENSQVWNELWGGCRAPIKSRGVRM